MISGMPDAGAQRATAPNRCIGRTIRAGYRPQVHGATAPHLGRFVGTSGEFWLDPHRSYYTGDRRR